MFRAPFISCCSPQVSAKQVECRSFAAEAKKVDTAQCSSVQGELGDAQKRLAPYLRMRVDHEQNVEGMEEMYVVRRC